MLALNLPEYGTRKLRNSFHLKEFKIMNLEENVIQVLSVDITINVTTKNCYVNRQLLYLFIQYVFG